MGALGARLLVSRQAVVIKQKLLATPPHTFRLPLILLAPQQPYSAEGRIHGGAEPAELAAQEWGAPTTQGSGPVG